MKQIFFVSGIDTDSGKTYATARLAEKWTREGKKVITQKFIQTGCSGISEDIITHRRLMDMPLLEADRNGTTCPIVFTYPASPHLAARLDGRVVDLDLVRSSSKQLLIDYDVILLEGAGGLMVPITEDYLTIDFIVEEKLPVIFVTSARLGSINHTLLSLEACMRRDIPVHSLIFNHYPPQDRVLFEDTRDFFKNFLNRNHPHADFIDLEYRQP